MESFAFSTISFFLILEMSSSGTLAILVNYFNFLFFFFHRCHHNHRIKLNKRPFTFLVSDRLFIKYYILLYFLIIISKFFISYVIHYYVYNSINPIYSNFFNPTISIPYFPSVFLPYDDIFHHLHLIFQVFLLLQQHHLLALQFYQPLQLFSFYEL